MRLERIPKSRMSLSWIWGGTMAGHWTRAVSIAHSFFRNNRIVFLASYIDAISESETPTSLVQLFINPEFRECPRICDVSFICEVLQWTTSLWWMNVVLHVLKMKYFIQELLGLCTSFSSSLHNFFSLLLTVTYFTSNQFYFCVTICGMWWSSLLNVNNPYFWYVICC